MGNVLSSICWNSSGQNYCNRDGYTDETAREKCSKTLCFRSSTHLGPYQLGWSLSSSSMKVTTSQEETLGLFTEDNMYDSWNSNEVVGDNTDGALKPICYVKPTFITNIVGVTN